MTDLVDRLRQMGNELSAAIRIDPAVAPLAAHDQALVFESADEIERLRADLKEANEAIRELQQAACDRDGVPMPSQRPVVEKLRAEIGHLREIIHAGADELEQLRAQIVASENLCLTAAGEIDRLSRLVAEMQNAQRRQELTAREET